MPPTATVTAFGIGDGLVAVKLEPPRAPEMNVVFRKAQFLERFKRIA